MMAVRRFPAIASSFAMPCRNSSVSHVVGVVAEALVPESRIR